MNNSQLHTRYVRLRSRGTGIKINDRFEQWQQMQREIQIAGRRSQESRNNRERGYLKIKSQIAKFRRLMNYPEYISDVDTLKSIRRILGRFMEEEDQRNENRQSFFQEAEWEWGYTQTEERCNECNGVGNVIVWTNQETGQKRRPSEVIAEKQHEIGQQIEYTSQKEEDGEEEEIVISEDEQTATPRPEQEPKISAETELEQQDEVEWGPPWPTQDTASQTESEEEDKRALDEAWEEAEAAENEEQGATAGVERESNSWVNNEELSAGGRKRTEIQQIESTEEEEEAEEEGEGERRILHTRIRRTWILKNIERETIIENKKVKRSYELDIERRDRRRKVVEVMTTEEERNARRRKALKFYQ